MSYYHGGNIKFSMSGLPPLTEAQIIGARKEYMRSLQELATRGKYFQALFDYCEEKMEEAYEEKSFKEMKRLYHRFQKQYIRKMKGK